MDLRPELNGSRTPLPVAPNPGMDASWETPPDVAVLYAWANLRDGRYRDFSAARREARARTRQQAALARGEFESRARASAELLAQQSQQAAHKAEAQARHHEALSRRALGEGRLEERDYQEQARHAAVQEAARCLEVAIQAHLEADRRNHAEQAARVAAHREAREVAEAHASAERQTRKYEGSRPPVARAGFVHLSTGTNAVPVAPRFSPPHAPFGSGMRPERFPSRRRLHPVTVDSTHNPLPESFRDPLSGSNAAPASAFLPGAYPAPILDAIPSSHPGPAASLPALVDGLRLSSPQNTRRSSSEISADAERSLTQAADSPGFALTGRGENSPSGLPERSLLLLAEAQVDAEPEGFLPAWLRESTHPDADQMDPMPHRFTTAPSSAMLLSPSREPSAARWHAHRTPPLPALGLAGHTDPRPATSFAPAYAVISLEPGTETASLGAALAHAFASQGQQVLLLQGAGCNLVPSLFGDGGSPWKGLSASASPGLDAPGSVSRWPEPAAAAPTGSGEPGSGLSPDPANFQVLIATPEASALVVLRSFVRLHGTVLVPICPEGQWLDTVRAVDRLFAQIRSEANVEAVRLRYVLVQYDGEEPAHRQIREDMRHHLAARLAPVELHRPAASHEAAAPGGTPSRECPGSGEGAACAGLARWLASAGHDAGEQLPARWAEA